MDRYSEALGELDQLRADGKVTPSQYELHKARLVAEAESKRGRGTKALLTVAAVIICLLVLIFISRMIAP